MLNKSQSSRSKTVSCILIAASLCVTGVTQTLAEPQLLDAPALQPLSIYGSEGIVAPYQLFLGTPKNWSSLVPESGSLDARNIKVEPAKVGRSNGMKVTWISGLGQMYLQSPEFRNLIEYPKAKGALVFDAIVHKAPEGQVTMRVDCGYPCKGMVDMTQSYRDMPLETKQTVKIALACFAKTGVKFAEVNTPLLISTEGAFAISLANVRWVPGAGQEHDALLCGN